VRRKGKTQIADSDQLERLRAEGCTEAQGYMFSPPVPAGARLKRGAEETDRQRRLLRAPPAATQPRRRAA
jgi:EAL domain-containing protein (putative c-di-GMP-specific phosphodiesterase class I)